LAVDEAMMDEITRVKKAISPQETLFVVDAMTGQDAVNTAKAFNDRLNIDGVVLTKLDGDARGGAALTIRSVVDKPIKFIGTGEKMEAIDEFHPDRMAGRILGMGDVVSLVERAQEQFDEKAARELNKKIAEGPVRLRRLPGADRADQEDGEHEGPHGHDPRRGQGLEEHGHPG
jgi:signal recognition particle subunit SRP54